MAKASCAENIQLAQTSPIRFGQPGASCNATLHEACAQVQHIANGIGNSHRGLGRSPTRRAPEQTSYL